MSRTFGALAILIPLVISMTGACGGSPTGPTTTSSTNTSAPGPNTSPPPPAEPAPSPQPPTSGPTPAPAPAPAPTPAPAPAPTVYHATTTSAHWYGESRLPETFDVTITATTVTVGPFPPASIATRTDTTLFAVLEPGPGGLTFQIYNSSWSVSGGAGQATGTLAK